MGYRQIRSSYHMLIEMDEPAPDPEFPEGISLRTYNPGKDAEAVYRAQTDSFRDHFGFVEEPFEEGLEHFKHFWEQPGFDPGLLFLAMDGPPGKLPGLASARLTQLTIPNRAGWARWESFVPGANAALGWRSCVIRSTNSIDAANVK